MLVVETLEQKPEKPPVKRENFSRNSLSLVSSLLSLTFHYFSLNQSVKPKALPFKQLNNQHLVGSNLGIQQSSRANLSAW